MKPKITITPIGYMKNEKKKIKGKMMKMFYRPEGNKVYDVKDIQTEIQRVQSKVKDFVKKSKQKINEKSQITMWFNTTNEMFKFNIQYNESLDLVNNSYIMKLNNSDADEVLLSDYDIHSFNFAFRLFK
jgi:hypothetical protein